MPAGALLFTYGRLQRPKIQIEVFGRVVPTTDDALAGYRLDASDSREEGVGAQVRHTPHTVLRRTGDARDKVLGKVLELTPEELEAADEYEFARLRRSPVELSSGRRAWVYVGDSLAG